MRINTLIHINIEKQTTNAPNVAADHHQTIIEDGVIETIVQEGETRNITDLPEEELDHVHQGDQDHHIATDMINQRKKMKRKRRTEMKD